MLKLILPHFISIFMFSIVSRRYINAPLSLPHPTYSYHKYNARKFVVRLAARPVNQ